MGTMEFRRGNSDESARLSAHNVAVFRQFLEVRHHTKRTTSGQYLVVITSDGRFRRLFLLAD